MQTESAIRQRHQLGRRGEDSYIGKKEAEEEIMDIKLGPFSCIFANRACGTERTQWTPLFRFEIYFARVYMYISI